MKWRPFKSRDWPENLPRSYFSKHDPEVPTFGALGPLILSLIDAVEGLTRRCDDLEREVLHLNGHVD